MMRSAASATSVVLAIAVPMVARAEISAGARTDHTIVEIAGADRHRIWVRNTSGELLSVYDPENSGDGRVVWTNHGKADSSHVSVDL